MIEVYQEAERTGPVALKRAIRKKAARWSLFITWLRSKTCQDVQKCNPPPLSLITIYYY